VLIVATPQPQISQKTEDVDMNATCGKQFAPYWSAKVLCMVKRRDQGKFGRNSLCPCGSGRKYKRCCAEGAVRHQPTPLIIQSPIPPERVLDAFVDRERKRSVVIANDFLMTSLQRDCPAIAKAFDEDFADEIKELNAVFSPVMGILIRAIHFDKTVQPPELRNVFFFLLQNAANTFVASFDLLRHGFRLQPGILIRGLIENLTTVCHLGQNPKDLERLQKGSFDSTTTLAAAKKVLPLFGPLYGVFSDSFAHISFNHLDLNPVVRCAPDDEAVQANFSFHRIAVWLLYVIAELTFFPEVEKPRYWREVENPERKPIYSYAPSDEEDRWREEFLTKWMRKPE
jgi:hypothetical protein